MADLIAGMVVALVIGIPIGWFWGRRKGGT